MVKQINPVDEKFIESYELDDWEIETEDGWKDITHLHKTIKYEVWELQTLTHSLKCADNHIVMVEGFKEKFVKDLTNNDNVITDTGLEKVISVKKIDIEPEEMYDLTVNSLNHTLYTNGILSHNTTISTIFLLWYALFNKDKTVAIVAHKQEAAIDILKRIKTAITMLPLWLQQGLEEDGWNKKSVSFENGSRILASATSAEALTSLTVNLLFLDEFAKVPPHVAEEFITSTYPVISSYIGNKIVMVSTPKGLNHFYEFWAKAIRKEDSNNFFPISVGWWEVPGRDDKWKKQTIADTNPIRFAQEFQCLKSQTIINIRDIKTKVEKNIEIGEFFKSKLYK